LKSKGTAMNKKTPTAATEPNPWDEVPVEPGPEVTVEQTVVPAKRAAELIRSQEQA
jgi:hypothetical protein